MQRFLLSSIKQMEMKIEIVVHITNTTRSQKWCATVLMWCHVCLYQWSQAFADLAKFLTWMTDVDVSLLFSILEFFPGVSSTTYFKYSFPLGEENTYRSFRYGRRNVLQVQYLWMKPGFSHSLARHVACQSPRTHLTTKQTFPGAASHYKFWPWLHCVLIVLA